MPVFLIWRQPPAIRSLHLNPQPPSWHKQIRHATRNAFGFQLACSGAGSPASVRDSKYANIGKLAAEPKHDFALFFMFSWQPFGALFQNGTSLACTSYGSCSFQSGQALGVS